MVYSIIRECPQTSVFCVRTSFLMVNSLEEELKSAAVECLFARATYNKHQRNETELHAMYPFVGIDLCIHNIEAACMYYIE